MAWLVDMRHKRSALSGLNYAFVVVLASFTLAICLLFSAALTAEECTQWALSVLRSVVLSALVTDPLLGIVVVLLRFFACWIALRMVSE
jgi:hypothetical protein